MSDRVFVDSNIFLYAFTEIDDKSNKEEIEKHKIASDIILSDINISTQVINEVSSKLYSEDMQHNLVVNDSLTIINPFED